MSSAIVCEWQANASQNYYSPSSGSGSIWFSSWFSGPQFFRKQICCPVVIPPVHSSDAEPVMVRKFCRPGPFGQSRQRYGQVMNAGRIKLLVGASLFLTAAQTTYFLCSRNLDCILIAWSLPSGIALGLGIFCFERISSGLQGYLGTRMRRLHAGFLLFFFYIVGYLVIFSALNAFPFGKILSAQTADSGVASEYGLFTVNITLILSLLSWLNWFRRAVLPDGGKFCSLFGKTAGGKRK